MDDGPTLEAIPSIYTITPIHQDHWLHQQYLFCYYHYHRCRCSYFQTSIFFRYQRHKMSREGDWMCCACQHLNFKKRDSCQRCRCPKYCTGTDMGSYCMNRTEVLAGDWYCNAVFCGAHNYASRTSCYKCGTPKDDYFGNEGGLVASGGSYVDNGSALPGWKSGDWVCSGLGCGVHNYASRTECFKCKSPRDYGG